VKKYFEAIPSQPAPPRPDSLAARAEGPRDLEDASQLRASTLPTAFPTDSARFTTPLRVMKPDSGGGQSSRLYQRLVRDEEVAAGSGAYADQRAARGWNRSSSRSGPARIPPPSKKAVYEEFGKLQTTPVEDWELEKIRTNAHRAAEPECAEHFGPCAALADEATNFGDPTSSTLTY